jgi:alpha-tubulin suppressor-like RCC1 family protein
VIDVAAGAGHCLGVTEDGSIFSWGEGGSGRLGHGDRDNRMVPTRISSNTMEGFRAVRVAAGIQHSMAVVVATPAAAGEGTGSRLLTWGGGEGGCLGHGDEEDKLVPTLVEGVANVVGVAGDDERSLVCTQEGAVMSFGLNTPGAGDPTLTFALGLGEDVGECVLQPTAIEGLVVDVESGCEEV